MKVLGINGVGTDGSTNIDVLGGKLENLGYEYIDANYRITRLFRFQTYDQGRQFEDAKYIAENYFEEGMILIAHSRGCLVAWRMLELGYRFKAMYLFRPAMNRDFLLPIKQHNVHCIYSKHDKAIKWGGLLPFNDFGNAGRYGFDSPDIVNLEAKKYASSEFWRHSDDFMEPQVNDWAFLIHRKTIELDKR